jgi:hypothetical protein
MKVYNAIFLLFCFTVTSTLMAEQKLEVIADSSLYSVVMIDRDFIDQVQYGEIGLFERKIKNTGAKSIEIDSIVNLSCKCKGSVFIENKILEPGEIATIKLFQDTHKKSMGINADAYVIYTMDKQIIPIDGSAKITVYRDVLIEPQSIDLGEIVKGKGEIEASVTVSSRENINDITVNASNTFIKSQIKIKPLSRLKEGDVIYQNEIRLWLDIPETYKKERLQEYIDIKLKNIRGRSPELRISISGDLVPPIKVDPRSLFLGFVNSSQEVIKEIRVCNVKKEDIEIKSVQFPNDVIASYEIVDLANWDKKIVCRLSFPPTKQGAVEFPIDIILFDKNKTIDKITVPCIYIGSTKGKSELK